MPLLHFFVSRSIKQACPIRHRRGCLTDCDLLANGPVWWLPRAGEFIRSVAANSHAALAPSPWCCRGFIRASGTKQATRSGKSGAPPFRFQTSLAHSQRSIVKNTTHKLPKGADVYLNSPSNVFMIYTRFTAVFNSGSLCLSQTYSPHIC